MLACDWNGHSYSASITLRGRLEGRVDIADSFSTSRLRTGALRMWS